MFWVILTAIAVALLIWVGYIRPFKYWTRMGVIQSPNPWFLLGDTWPTIFRKKNVAEWMDWMYNMHPNSRFTGIYQFYTPILFIKDPDIIKQITVKDFDYFPDHDGFTGDEDVDPLMGKNLMSLKGQRWRDMRSVLSASFTGSKMKLIYDLIAEESEKFVNHFKKQDQTLKLEMKDTFTRYTNDVIASASFGIKVDSLENPTNEFFMYGKEATNFSGVIIFIKFIGAKIFPWLFKVLNIGFFSKKVSDYFCALINETIKTREEQDIVRPDMINLLLEVRKKQKTESENGTDKTARKRQMQISNMDIASQAMIFFLAGFDSVSSSMCFTVYELAINPEIQNKLREEIREVYKKTNGKPSYEELLDMKYLDMVISESLRKWPVTPATERLCAKPYILEPMHPGDPVITFREKDLVLIPVYSIQHDPKYYPDPEKFIPERFSEENKSKIQPYTNIPFGVGPRMCIGFRFALLEMKSIIFHLVYSFEVVPSEDTKVPLEMSKDAMNFTAKGGFPLMLKRL